MLRTFVVAAFAASAFAAVPLLLERGPAATGGADMAAQAPVAVSAPAQPPPANMPGRRKELIEADASGHFSADFRLNGRAVPAMIDTGATVVAINRTTARRIGVDVAEKDFTGFAQTANGRVRAAPVTIERVALGRIEARDVPAVVLDDRALSGALVGMSFLSRLKRYSVENGRLALER